MMSAPVSFLDLNNVPKDEGVKIKWQTAAPTHQLVSSSRHLPHSLPLGIPQRQGALIILTNYCRAKT
jgi:hypothetical protein